MGKVILRIVSTSKTIMISGILVITGMFSGCQTVPKSDESTVWKQRLLLHREVWKLVNDHYYDPSFRGLDWNQIGSASREQIEQSGNLEEVYSVLKDMVNGLDDRHTFLLSPEEYADLLRAEYVGVGFMTFNHSDEKDLNVVIRVVPGSPADRAGIKPGWLFLNGLEMNPDNRTTGVEEKFRFLDHFQRLQEISLTPEELPKVAADWEATLYNDELLYLRFDNFEEGLELWIARQLIEHEDLKGIILDVRWNPGGVQICVGQNPFPFPAPPYRNRNHCFP
jgi:C-terminal processing protease CtpA/Prc